MGLLTTTAFVLRVDPISERDLVAALLTKEQGVVRAAVKGARGRSRRAAALQTLCEVSATLFRREGADLARLDSVELLHGSYPLAERPETAMLVPYLAESALTFVPESEPGGEVYRLVRHVRDALEGGLPPALCARYFEVWLLKLSGVLPEEGTCAVCGDPIPPGDALLDGVAGGLCHPACAPRGGAVVSAAARGLLRATRRLPLPRVAPLAEAGEEALAGVEALCRDARRRFLGHELKSYRFLSALA